MLAMCGSQPLYGKLSNIFGRKALLLTSYTFFAVGNFICGVAPTMNTAVLGRLVGGIGGAGMSSVVSFLVADIVPLRDVATYRSYINIVQTVGRSCGGPIGGYLAETMGWRW
jgi:MFS family permease